MLNSHPNIVSPPECGFLHWWYPKYQDWKWNNNSEADLERYITDLSNSKKIETWNISFPKLADFLFKQRPDSYNDLVTLVYVFYGMMNGKNPSVIADKNNYYINYLNDLRRIWPDAVYIHLIRDGRDVACSYIDLKNMSSNSVYKPNLSNKINEIAVEWRDNNEAIASFISSFSARSGKTIKYEDLILKTESVLREVSLFLDIPFHREMLSYNDARNHNEPVQTMDWKKKTLENPDPQRISRFRSCLRKDEIELFNSIAEKTLLKFNYSLS
jgi:hypothetical protein